MTNPTKLLATCLLLIITLGLCSCEKESPKNVINECIIIKEIDTLRIAPSLAKEVRDSITPDGILQLLIDGNLRFADTQNPYTVRNHSYSVRKSSLAGQHPMAIILSCLDSRIPVEDVFDRGVGDLFVARVAGNVVNPDILASMEFGTAVAGAKVILVVGHDKCGAVSAALNPEPYIEAISKRMNRDSLGDYELRNLQGLFSAINPSGDDLDAEIKANVIRTVKRISIESPIIGALVKNGDLIIKGAIYHMATGKIEMLESNKE